MIDSSARPIPDATVMVYHAGVLNGYSTFCPSCYRDCGKRTKTDSAGNYVISKLDSGLWFDLLVVRDGYAPEIIKVKDSIRSLYVNNVSTSVGQVSSPSVGSTVVLLVSLVSV